jgi:hypothetical protein
MKSRSIQTSIFELQISEFWVLELKLKSQILRVYNPIPEF